MKKSNCKGERAKRTKGFYNIITEFCDRLSPIGENTTFSVPELFKKSDGIYFNMTDRSNIAEKYLKHRYEKVNSLK